MTSYFKVSAEWLKACGRAASPDTFEIKRDVLTQDLRGNSARFYDLVTPEGIWVVASYRGIVVDAPPAPKARKTRNAKIATLINSITVAIHMQARDEAKGDKEGARFWFDRQAADTVELADKYGIELPGLQVLRKHLEYVAIRDAAQNAAALAA